MKQSRRFWASLALVAVLAVGAVVLVQPALLFGAAGALAWLIAQQYWFVSEARWTNTALSIDQTIQSPTFVGDSRPFTLSATLPRQSDLQIRVEPGVPVAGDTSLSNVVLDPDERAVERTADLSWRVAGQFTFEPATVTIQDRWGLFEAEFTTGTKPAARVEPPTPRDAYVIEGTARILSTLGPRDTLLRGTGFDLGDIREYIPGDPMTRIDWKATARLNKLHVREFEAETSVVTTMVLDARAGMRTGPSGNTKLDYLRQVALALVDGSRRSSEPVGMYVLDEDGPSALPASATQQQYARIREQLYELSTGGGSVSGNARTHRRTPEDAARALRALDDDESPFSRTLRPYLSSRESYAAGIEADPFYRLTRSARTTLAGTGSVLTVLLTDDANRAVVQEAARLSRRRDGRVVVFLTPTALFESGDALTTYERLREFERFRRKLASLSGVMVLEIGPGFRLERVLRVAEEQRSLVGAV